MRSGVGEEENQHVPLHRLERIVAMDFYVAFGIFFKLIFLVPFSEKGNTTELNIICARVASMSQQSELHHGRRR